MLVIIRFSVNVWPVCLWIQVYRVLFLIPKSIAVWDIGFSPSRANLIADSLNYDEYSVCCLLDI